MYKTIYAVILFKDLGEKNESKRVLISTTDFDEAKKCFESEYKKSYKPSAIHSGGKNTEFWFFRGKTWDFLISFEEVGWIDDEGKHDYVDCFGNPIVLTK